jgi:hypothetical protein
MLWVTWRQFRAQALVAAAALAAFAITLLITGIGVRDRARTVGLDGCHAKHDCEQLATNFINQLHAGGPYQLLFSVGAVAVYVVPGLIGLFWGAPLIARELETGTYRVAWNQSVGRNRWLAVKLGLVGLAAMATAGLFSLLITWWASPIDEALDLTGPNAAIGLVRLDPTLFGARGIVPVGYAAFALVLGVTLGVLIRRTVPAMAATLAVFVGIQIFWPNWIRPHLISPAVARSPLGSAVNEFMISPPSDKVTILGVWHRSGAWVLSDKTITPSGNIFTGPATKACLQGTQQQCNAWLASKDLRQLVTFQPASRFWALQWYETAIFVVLAVALAGFCAWRIRRRHLA